MVMKVFNEDIFYLIIRRKAQSIFVPATESTTVLQLKEALYFITKKQSDEVRLYIDDEVMEDDKCLHHYDLLSSSATISELSTIGMAFKIGDEFEELEIEDV